MQLSKIATQNGNIYDFIYISGCILCNKIHIIHTYMLVMLCFIKIVVI